MSLRSLAALALAVVAQSPEVAPREGDWAEVERVAFKTEWRLPEALWRAPDEANDAKLLAVALRELVTRDFRAALPAGERDVDWCGNFGDVAVELARRGGKKDALRAMLAELRAARPSLARELEPCARELFQVGALLSPKWTADEDKDDDGLYFGAPIELRAAASEPWKSHKGSRKLQQAAAFVRADLEALKAAENDFPAVSGERGERYDFIGPVPASYVRGERDGAPFAAHVVRFRYDLPFPFSHFDCDLAVLTELDPERRLTTYIYSQSSDFLWMAGQDFVQPVRTSKGEWCGTLLIRLYGFDIEGVPDGDAERASSLRGSLGNLKLRAEKRFAEYGGPPRTIDGAVPEFAVLGELKK